MKAKGALEITGEARYDQRVMTKDSGRSIELFFVNGDPDGMVTATIPFQWTGHVLVSNRIQIKQALGREEARRPGVYLLVGDIEGDHSLYVGEADEIRSRIQDHVKGKDWWFTAIMITSSGESLNKEHRRYLEHRLHEDTGRIGKVKLDNANIPTVGSLNEAGKVHMDDFLKNICLVLPALRFDFLTEKAPSHEPSKGTVIYFTMAVERHRVKARAWQEEGQFTVEAGSIVRGEWTNKKTSHHGYARLFADLQTQGVLVRHGKNLKFKENYAFNSSSAAASVVAGRFATGPKSWFVENTKTTYGEWEQQNLE